MKRIILAAVIIALLMSGTAVGTTMVTSGTIADETITAEDLGPDVTRVKVANVTIPSEPDVVETRCYPISTGGETCNEYILSEATTKTKTIRCPGGNVTGGGLRFLDIADMWNLDVQSYPASDNAWTYILYNSGPDDISVQLRIVCI